MKHVLFILILHFFSVSVSFGQDVTLYNQFNGRYDYLAIGNTLNLEENGPLTNCSISSSSSANLNLESTQVVQAAYLYWAGSGTGDLEVSLNGNDITAERTFSDALDDTRLFFSAFADITSFVIENGNGIYTLSNFDLSTVIPPYCPTGTNFAGWAITIVYQDGSLPLNQINVYDGLQSVPNELTITLDNLNVLDNEGAKIGFIAWEGDDALAVNEQLSINGNIIGNPPLNPSNNAFNGTNSFTGETNLFNMDIDFYGIQNNISIGDTSATIQLTSGQDFVMINNIITVLNSQLPDATIDFDTITLACNSRTIEIDYTVSNTNSTATLPMNTPIAFYADSILIGQDTTLTNIPIGGMESGSITIDIPQNIEDIFTLSAVVDDNGMGIGDVPEINEDNNDQISLLELLIIPPISELPALVECDTGFNMAQFDLTVQYANISAEPESITFHLNEEDAESGDNTINFPENFVNDQSPQSIYVRISKDICFETAVFNLEVENCPPRIPEGLSPNEDGLNDEFLITGLRDIFEDFELLIYNRYGTLIYKGNNDIPNWNGTANKGINNKGKPMPVGTYFYILHLNDPAYRSISGWVYLNK